MSSQSEFGNGYSIRHNESVDGKIMPSDTSDDILAQSMNYLAINSPSASYRRQSPKTPVSGQFNCQRSVSSTARKASLSPLNISTPSSSRRSSSAQFLNASTPTGKAESLTNGMTSESPRPTPESIATNYFKAELEVHENKEQSGDTIVILHDSCYGHRYSRPRTSKATLSSIVERPERIHASVLGISVAYVRLGERYTHNRHAMFPGKDLTTVPVIPFRIFKTSRRTALSSSTVTNVHGTKWMNEFKTMCDAAEIRLAMHENELLRPELNSSPDQEELGKLHEGDLYLCSESLNAIEGALGAVCEGVDAVFRGAASKKGPHRAFVAIRPPGHHCSASFPSGFCWVNNVHVGISHASLTHGLTHAAIIDFDLHHGDGSQAIAWENNKRAISAAKNALPWKKTSIGYFSLHDINSYPCEMGDEEKIKNASLCIENSHGQSIWNVHLQPWKTEAEFWKLYETKYAVLLEKARSYLCAQVERLRLRSNGTNPKGAIFISAGFDASEWESPSMQRHRVSVPTEFYARLTRDVVQLAAEDGTAVEGRIISVLEGGYSDRALSTGVLSHLSGMTSPNTMVGQIPIACCLDIDRMNDVTSGQSPTSPTLSHSRLNYDPAWWSLSCLDELDAVYNSPKTIEPKIHREVLTTFSSPTQSFISKVTAPAARRLLVEKLNTQTSTTHPVTRNKYPPLEVSWAISALELSKLLIPTERQTMSCKPENLTAEIMRRNLARIQQDDQSSFLSKVNSVTNEKYGHMALRVRKPVRVTDVYGEKELQKPVTKGNQKKAISTVTLNENKNKNSNKDSITSNSKFKRTKNSAISCSESSAGTSNHVVIPQAVKKNRGTLKQSRVDEGHRIAENRARKKPQSYESTTISTKSTHGETVTEKIENQTNSELKAISANLESDCMDNLTSKMKGVTISLITKRQRAAREREKEKLKTQQNESNGITNKSVISLSKPSTTEGITSTSPSSFESISKEICSRASDQLFVKAQTPVHANNSSNIRETRASTGKRKVKSIASPVKFTENSRVATPEIWDSGLTAALPHKSHVPILLQQQQTSRPQSPILPDHLIPLPPSFVEKREEVPGEEMKIPKNRHSPIDEEQKPIEQGQQHRKQEIDEEQYLNQDQSLNQMESPQPSDLSEWQLSKVITINKPCHDSIISDLSKLEVKDNEVDNSLAALLSSSMNIDSVS